MSIIHTQYLDRYQLEQIYALHRACGAADGNLIPIYRHLLPKPRPFPVNILYYQDKTLVGFLRVFFFYDRQAELSIFVEPNHRRQGIGSQMLETILPIVQSQFTEIISVSVPHNTANAWLTKLGFEWQKSQHIMQYDIKKPFTFPKNTASIRQATNADLDTLCAIHKSGFPKEDSDMKDHFAALIHDPDYVIFVLEKDGCLLGKAHIRWEPNAACLADLAMLPEFRCQGYGAALIQHSIYHALLRNRTCIFLEIEDDNQRAFKLYSQLGFSITNTHDYWNISLDLTEFNLTHFLQRI